jgi:hypothetical protein
LLKALGAAKAALALVPQSDEERNDEVKIEITDTEVEDLAGYVRGLAGAGDGPGAEQAIREAVTEVQSNLEAQVVARAILKLK